MLVFSLIIPCFNEEKNIKAMYEAIVEAFFDCGNDYEMVFVNDGSTDGTAREIKELLKNSKERITYLDFSRNFGKEAAILAGLENCEGDYAVIIDGDLQQPPKVALEMFNYLSSHPDCDCVTAYQEKRIENKCTSFVKGLFYKVINKISEVEFISNASDFRAMKRNMIDAVLSLEESLRFSKGIFAWTGFHVHFIPYIADKRNAGETKWTIKKLFRYALDGIIAFSTKLLKIPSILSFLTLVAAFVFMITEKLMNTFDDTSLIVFMILLMSSLIMFSISIVSIYIRCIYTETKQRPTYILREKVKSQKIEKQ